MKSLRMKIEAGSSPPASASHTPQYVSIMSRPNISRYSGRIAAAPVITDDSNSSR